MYIEFQDGLVIFFIFLATAGLYQTLMAWLDRHNAGKNDSPISRILIRPERDYSLNESIHDPEQEELPAESSARRQSRKV